MDLDWTVEIRSGGERVTGGEPRWRRTVGKTEEVAGAPRSKRFGHRLAREKLEKQEEKKANAMVGLGRRRRLVGDAMLDGAARARWRNIGGAAPVVESEGEAKKGTRSSLTSRRSSTRKLRRRRSSETANRPRWWISCGSARAWRRTTGSRLL